MKKGTKVELPFWLSKILAGRNYISVSVPKCFGPRSRRDLEADASTVNLRSKCYYFYEYGIKLGKL